MRWEDTSPDTPLTGMTAGDLLDAIGWALTNYHAAQHGGQADVAGFTIQAGKLTLPVIADRRVAVMGWKEAGLWGQWNSNFWGVATVG